MGSTWWYHVMRDSSHWSRGTGGLSQARANDKEVFNKTDINQIQIHSSVFIGNSSSSWWETKRVDKNVLMIINYRWYVSSTTTSIFHNRGASCLKDHVAEFARRLDHVAWSSKIMEEIFWERFSKVLRCVCWSRFSKDCWISLHHFYESWSTRRCRRNYEQNSDTCSEILVNRLQD